MASTYLQLTNKVLNKLNEVELTSSTFDDARGVYSVVKGAINDSINHINNEEYAWPFNFVNEQSKTLAAGTVVYGFESDFKVADWDSFFIYKDGTLATATRILKPINEHMWQTYRKERDLDNTTSGLDMPEFVFPYGNNQFGVTENPDQAYTLKYNYWSLPTQLSVHGDATTIPVMWDYVIVLGAMWYGNLFKSDEGAADRTEKNYMNGIDRMRSILINRNQTMESTMVNFGQRQTAQSAFDVVSS